MDQIEHRRRSSDLPESRGVLRGRGLEVRRLHRHIVDLLGGQRRMIEKAFAQVSEIPVPISGGSDALVDLHHMDSGPRYVRGSQRAQHHPRCVTTAHGHNKTTSRGDCRPCVVRNDCRGALRDRVGGVKYFNVQRAHAA